MDIEDKKRVARIGTMILSTSMIFSTGCKKAYACDEDEDIQCIEYTIQRGDNLRGISKHFYDDAQYYDELAEFNHIKNPNLIITGNKLSVPENVEDLLNATEEKKEIAESYLIQKGDTLSAISKKYYGTSSYAWALATYNNLENPNLIRTGRYLNIHSLEVIKNVKVRDYSYVVNPPKHRDEHDHHHDEGFCPSLHPKH